MPGYLLDSSSTIMCMHAPGKAQPAGTNPKVKVSGQPITTQTNSYTISGCPFTPANGGNGPCVTAQWTVVATRVRAGGVPVLLKDSQAVCVPTGTGLQILVTQMRVKGT